MSPTLSSPNRLVRAYASIAWALAHEAANAPSEEVSREKSAAAIVMAIACVETYWNVFAQLWLSQNPEFPHRLQVEADLRQKKNLGRKNEDWPLLFFGKKVDLGSGPGQRFKFWLDSRNRLMHFNSEAHQFEHENIIIMGLIDTTAYESLKPEDGIASIRAAEEFIEYLLRLQAIPEEQVPHAMHHWVGRVPSAA
jgi:hypothetical protein